jgi:MoaA/NifB/PqqE/SkfB family radical SAM enzyme
MGLAMMKPPTFLFVHLSEECNLRCTHCHYWKPSIRPKADNISIERKMELLSEFASLNPRGVVVTCGAESTMHLDEFFQFTRECRRLGLRCLSVTNGSKISTSTIADQVVADGPTEISVSLDSHVESLHDEMRGVKGSFKSAARAIKLLLESRRKLGRMGQRVHAMLLLFDDNYLDLEDTYDFALNELGVDKLKINVLQPTFGCSSGPDEFFTRHSRMDADRLEAVLHRCNQRFKLNANPIWISQVGMYVRTLSKAAVNERGWSVPIHTTEQICNSPDRNIVIDMSGTARLCVSEGFPGMDLRHPGDMLFFWESSGILRGQMRTCTQLCGITHSMRRISSTFDGLTHFD